MGKAINKFKTAEFLAQQALKATRTATKQTQLPVPTAATVLEAGTKQAASTGMPHIAADKANYATKLSTARHATEPGTSLQASAAVKKQLASKNGKRSFATSAADKDEPAKSAQPVNKKAKIVKTVPVATIYAAPTPQGMRSTSQLCAGHSCTAHL